MNINPESKPIAEVFPIEGKVIYKIPIYQRNYSWNTQNIEDLFNDVLNESNGYYIGNLLVTKNQEDSTKLDVVDGQQRLTTIALFFLAIYEQLMEMSGEDGADQQRIGGLTNDISRKLVIDKTIPRLELLDRDAQVFNNYLEILDKKEKGKFGNRAFAKRYKFIQELTCDYLKTFEDIDNFYSNLNSVELLRITVADITDAFSVFSSLNAKGLPLTLIDLLKSHYLGKAISEISKEDALAEWDKLIDLFSDYSKEPNSFAITQFLLNNYDTFESKENSSITKNSALRRYQKLFDKKGYKYMQKLIERAKLFSAVSPIVDIDKSIEYSELMFKSIEKLMKLDASQTYPLMLFLLDKHSEGKVEDEVVIEVFEFLTKYYVRRNIVLKPKSSNIRAKIIDIVRYLSEEEDLSFSILPKIKEILCAISVTDEEFRTALSGSVYDVSYQTVRFILISLEREFGNFFTKHNPDNLDAYIESKSAKKMPIWTLEHILPENTNLKNGWPEMISPDNFDEAVNIQQSNMHRLGNLTLTAYNSEMSDKSFIDKRDYKDDNNFTGLRTKIFLNESLVEEGEEIGNKDTWLISDIDRRTNFLIDCIIEKFQLK